MALTSDILKQYEFDWEMLEVVIGGKSAIDTGTALRIRSPDEAVRFMECYGYDIENPIEKAELFGNFQEALSFIRRYFLQPDNPEGLKIEIPRKIAELTDIGQLITMASQPTGASPTQALVSLWACSIIKVMHTIAHMDKDLRSNYFVDIQKQILDRFYRFIHRDENGEMFLGRDTRDLDLVKLVAFESKPKKARDSVLLKLLHKPENVAEDIFDRVGIRFVTKNRFDAIRIVKFLKDRHVIMPANIKPSRSRNTLVDEKKFASEVQRLLTEAERGQLAAADIYGKLVTFCDGEEANPNAGKSEDNPHSSQHYRAIQFTGRQLVKIINPMYDDLRALKSAMKGTTAPDEIVKIAERIDLRNIQKEIRFFYPFEVQVLDEQSHSENLAGRGSHSNYKKSQVQAAMKRVLSELIRFSDNSHAPG